MNLSYTPRPFYPDEKRLLKALRTSEEKKRYSGIKFYHYLIAASLAIAFAWLAPIVQGFFGWLFGTIAVFSVGFIVFTPYEVYKKKKARKQSLENLDEFIVADTVSTCRIKASRIAIAEEYEDEGDLFMLELAPDAILWLWNVDFSLGKNFPCLEFEMYEEKFFKTIGRTGYPLSEKITPVPIDKKAKWAWFREVGVPADLTIESGSFDKKVAEIKSYGK